MPETTTRHAIVRPPADSYVHAISSTGATIDLAVARAQHAEYCQALAAAGASVEALLPDERFPDGCFMQDPAVVIADHAIITRMGAASRRGEEDGAAQALAGRLPLHHITAPATLEGGDILVLPDRVYVGLSGRTNDEGVRQLAGVLRPLGLSVTGVTIGAYLHLLTAVTYIGEGCVLVVEDFADHPAIAHLEQIRVPLAEAYAANALALGRNVILPAGHAVTARAVRARGFEPIEAPLSEFAKADGGVTCLSLII